MPSQFTEPYGQDLHEADDADADTGSDGAPSPLVIDG
jgi:hypothetical protein